MLCFVFFVDVVVFLILEFVSGVILNVLLIFFKFVVVCGYLVLIFFYVLLVVFVIVS